MRYTRRCVSWERMRLKTTSGEGKTTMDFENHFGNRNQQVVQVTNMIQQTICSLQISLRHALPVNVYGYAIQQV